MRVVIDDKTFQVNDNLKEKLDKFAEQMVEDHINSNNGPLKVSIKGIVRLILADLERKGAPLELVRCNGQDPSVVFMKFIMLFVHQYMEKMEIVINTEEKVLLLE